MKIQGLFLSMLALMLVMGCTSGTPRSARGSSEDLPYLGGRPNPNYRGSVAAEPMSPAMSEVSDSAEVVVEESVVAEPESMESKVVEEAPVVEEAVALEVVEPEEPVSETDAQQSLSDAMNDLEAAMDDGMSSGNADGAADSMAVAVSQAEAAIDTMNQPLEVTDEAMVEVDETADAVTGMMDVTSEAMDAVSYDDAMEVLTIDFGNGNVYDYLGVPVDVYEQFLKADSKGGFFAETIKEKYESLRR